MDGWARQGIQEYLAWSPGSIGEMAEVQEGEGIAQRTKIDSSWAGNFPSVVLLLIASQ